MTRQVSQNKNIVNTNTYSSDTILNKGWRQNLIAANTVGQKMCINNTPCSEGNRTKIAQSESWTVVRLTELFVHRDAEAVSNKYRETLKLLETHQRAFKQTQNSTQQAREREGARCVICRPFHSPSISCSCYYCGTLPSTTPTPLPSSICWRSLMTIFDVLKYVFQLLLQPCKVRCKTNFIGQA